MRNDEKTGTKYFEETRDKASAAVNAGIEKAKQMGEKARDAAANFGERAKETASSFGSQASDTAKSFTDRAREMASTAAEKAKDTATQVAGAVGSAISEKADTVSSAVGDGMKTIAQTIREKTPREGILGTASDTVANSLEAGGQYIEEHGIAGLCQDVGAVIRRNPIPALFIGVGLGFLIARATTSRRL